MLTTEILTVANAVMLIAEIGILHIMVKLYTEILKVEHIKRIK